MSTQTFIKYILPIALTASIGSTADPTILCGVPPKASDLVVNQKAAVKQAPAPSARSNPAPSIVEKINALTPQERGSLLALLNNGTAEELVAINGIAEARARTILSSRPIFELGDLMLLPGFGPGLLSKVIAHREVAMQ